jgi:glycosyltransferase involved in cell wall biosynthesis
MRIGMMMDMYKPHISGITNYVSLNKQILESWGHKVFIFTFGNQDFEDDELHIVRSPGLPINVQETGFHVSFRYSQIAQNKLRTMDVAHVHHPFQSGPLALRYCQSRGIPVIFTNHTRYDLYAQHYLPPFISDLVGTTFLQTYLPGFCQRCDLVIAPSPGVMKVLHDLGVHSPIQVIPNGIDLAPFQNVPQHPTTRAELSLPEDALVLMYVGRVGPEKNLTFLLRSFFGVAAVRPEVVLAIVGDGPEMENLHDHAAASGYAERVKFFGKVDYAAVPGYLAVADVFVTASETEVHPLSLIEAMAAGVPPLGITSPGVGDTIVDDENGLLSSPDIAAFTAKLMRLVMEPETRHRLAANAREAAQAYDINRTARAVLDEYERLVAKKTQRLSGWPSLRQRLRRLFS